MAKLTKRQQVIAEKVEPGKVYSIDEAAALLSELSTVKFKESVEVAINLGIDARKSDQGVRSATVLPHGTGKTMRVAVFTQGANAEAALEAGADVVGMEDLAETIKGGDVNFDVVIASPDAMRVVGALGQVLGPRGLMPNPKSGTVTMDVGKAVTEIKQGKIDFKVDKYGIVHTAVGKVSFESGKIMDNAKEFINTIVKLKPTAAKGTYIKSIYLSSTMSSGIQVDPKSVQE